ncbi:MAG: hypothetical protein KKA73_18305 [Chloroflexi bacterium]|nr:hypothetical protein [Chloroflexota bacterium]MBU1749640.1 hypothetical protein [Chloroflexota bacterium]
MRTKVYNRTIQFSNEPFPAFRYVGPGQPLLLLPVTGKVQVEDNALTSRVKLVPQRENKGYVAVPARKRFAGTVVMDRLAGKDVKIVAGAEYLFAGRTIEKAGRVTEIVFAALLRGDETLVIVADGHEFTYTTEAKAHCSAQPVTAQPQPRPQPQRIRVKAPQNLIPMMDAPIGYAHVGHSTDGQPVWLNLAAFTVGVNPLTGGTVDIATAGKLLGAAEQAPVPYALMTAAAAATKHGQEA